MRAAPMAKRKFIPPISAPLHKSVEQQLIEKAVLPDVPLRPDVGQLPL